MAGEIEYENFIYENGDAIFPFTGHFMILLFVVLISIILMNLLVGLAVSDIQVHIATVDIFYCNIRRQNHNLCDSVLSNSITEFVGKICII